MEIDYNKYEPVIGLEVHAQLLTKSKAYASDSTEFLDDPNKNISAITLGYPGTLPKPNKKHIEFAVLLGLACNCDINRNNEFARKNYFYPDLPKGYQITQDKTPICTNGFVKVKNEKGIEKKILLTRIHIEEDAGKSIHDLDPFNTLVDYNRAGVPLVEIVTEPVITSSTEAYQYVTEIRKLVRYLEICDGNMEEGSLRCDANISVRLKGEQKFGVKVEVKNMNSIRNVQRAIEYEIKRQIEAIENNEKIYQETRSFDAGKDITISMRSKETANDYRYFPEPDICPIILTEEYIQAVKEKMPPLPEELFNKYVNQLGLSSYDAGIITDSKDIALYFEQIIKHTNNYKAAANLLMGAVKSYLNENALHISEFKVSGERLAQLIKLVDEGIVNNTVANQNIFPLLIKHIDKTAEQIAKENNYIIENNADELQQFIKMAIEKYPDKVKEYKEGKHGLIGLFMGEVMKLTKGKIDPKTANKLVKETLDNLN